MAAACAAAGFFLAGCDLSDSDHAARKTGVDAARQVAAAGDLKTNESLLQKWLESGSFTPTETEYKQYVIAANAEGELQAAVQKLSSAISGLENPGLKATLETQQGAAQLELSLTRFVLVQKDMNSLTEQAMALQAVSQQAIDAGSRAAAMDGDAKQAAKIVEQMKAAADKAAADLTARQGALSTAQARVKEVQDQISSKDAQARKIYADTDAAFKAAAALKGAEAIAAGQKAMQDRGAGDRLMEELGNLAPDLLQAQAALELAQTAVKNTENLAKASAEAHKAVGESATRKAQQARDMLAEANKIVDGEGGVKAQLATFITSYSALDARIKAALSAADQSATSYQQAANDHRAARAAASTLAATKELESTDPLVKYSKDERITATLLWSQSAAAQQGGRICLAATEMHTIADASVKLAVLAHTKASQTSTAAIPASSFQDAGQRFTRAAELGASGNKVTGGGVVGQDVDKIRWIGFGIEATARAGLYRTDNKPATLAEAKTLAGRATQANPAIESQMAWLSELK
jgi:hypothetical protein